MKNLLVIPLLLTLAFTCKAQINLEVEKDARIEGILWIDSLLRTGYIITAPNGDTTSVIIGLQAGSAHDGFLKRSVFIGRNTGKSNTTGNWNVFVGELAGESNTTGQNNVFLGQRSGQDNTTGNWNTFVGDDAGMNNITGKQHTFVGDRAGRGNTGGEQNTFVGSDAGLQLISGNENTFIGEGSGRNMSSGGWNTFVGDDAGRAAADGSSHNTYIGDDAGVNNDGNYNTAVGKSAASSPIVFSNSTFLGYDAEPSGPVYNSMALGAGALVNDSNAVVIGNSAVNSIGGWADWTNISDSRFKKDVSKQVPGLNFILALNPVSYRLDYDLIAAAGNQEIIPTKRHLSQYHSGFLAQEVEAVMNELGVEFSGLDKPRNEGGSYGLRYAQFVVPLVKAVQEQQTQIEQLAKENAALKAQLTEMDDLKARMAKMEALLFQ